MKRKLAVLITSILFISIILSGCNQQAIVTHSEIYTMAKSFAIDTLKAPATAQFPSLEDVFIAKDTDNSWDVIFYVDAQNSYGALIRTYLWYNMANTGDTWIVIRDYSDDAAHELYNNLKNL